jgi:hypothetical protein
LNFTKRITPLTTQKVYLNATDGLGTEFKAAQEFKSDEDGKLKINNDQFRNFIAKDFVKIIMIGN